MPGAALSLALAGLVLAPLVEGPPAGEGLRLGAGWHVATLPKQTKPVTRFTPERVDDRPALRIEAQSSYGNLVHELPAGPVPQGLHWSWRMQLANPAVDLRTKAGDDAAVKVCLSFDLPLDSVPFGDRQLLRLARAASGEPLPAATLCWVWGHREAHDSALDNAYSRRVRYIVLRNAGDATGTWFDEHRDVAADFRRVFGDEAATVPALTAVGVAGDADNTAGRSVAHVSGLRFEP